MKVKTLALAESLDMRGEYVRRTCRHWLLVPAGWWWWLREGWKRSKSVVDDRNPSSVWDL